MADQCCNKSIQEKIQFRTKDSKKRTERTNGGWFDFILVGIFFF